MGETKPVFAAGCIEELKDRLASLGVADNDVAFEPIYWADVLSPREEWLYQKLCVEKHLCNYFGVRKFELTALADAVAYRYIPDDPQSVYVRIHRRVREAFASLRAKIDSDKSPIVILAHSLGGHVISNYIWDAQHAMRYKGDEQAWTRFESAETLCGLVTFGCNIPLFTLACNEIKAIRFPGDDLPPALKEQSRWLNFYCKTDILSFPLAPLAGGYEKVQDKSILAGSICTFWNPGSHTGYWTDNSFTKPVANLLRNLVALL
jgi:hypothetical protein